MSALFETFRIFGAAVIGLTFLLAVLLTWTWLAFEAGYHACK